MARRGAGWASAHPGFGRIERIAALLLAHPKLGGQVGNFLRPCTMNQVVEILIFHYILSSSDLPKSSAEIGILQTLMPCSSVVPK